MYPLGVPLPTPTAEQLARSFPVVSEGRSLACLGVEEGPSGPALVFELTVTEDGEVMEIRQQPVALEGLGSADPEALAARVRERIGLERYAFASPSLLLARPFERVAARDERPVEAQRWDVYDQLAKQAHDTGFEARFDRIYVWPEAPRTLYYLFLIDGVVGGSGFEVFLGQAQMDEILGALDALEAAGCPRLLERLRQGLGLAWSEGAEFVAQADEDWIDDEALPVPEGEGRPWSRIDSHEEGGSYWLLRHELGPRRVAYFNAHRDEIVAR